MCAESPLCKYFDYLEVSSGTFVFSFGFTLLFFVFCFFPPELCKEQLLFLVYVNFLSNKDDV